jgi:hypothetical protein
MKTFLFILILCLCFCSAARSQQTNLPSVSGNFSDVAVDTFLMQLQSQTYYHFYYDTAQLGPIRINLSVTNQSLKSVLEKAFEHTNIYYAIDRHNNVFVSKGLAVQTTLPEGFFSGKINNKAPFANNEATDFTYDTTKGKSSTIENKLIIIGENTNNGTNRFTIAGYVRDAKTGEPLIGASISDMDTKVAITTDQFGYFVITLSKGSHTLVVQSIAMRDTKRQIVVQGDGKINIDMQQQVMTLKRVTVSSEKMSNIKGLQMGLQRLDIKTIKQVPVVFGEADVLRVALTMPGVKSVGEASTGLNVRGGAADQNLILFNDATIYNPSHFFGLFSAFNPEVVKDVELYKSSIPAKYGGRLSSVLEINSREGNKKDIIGSAGIGVLTSRFNLEGPLKKDKSSFNIGARATYADWLLHLLPDQYKNSKAGFYDINMDINHEINKKNTIYLTAYLSKDRFNLNSDKSYNYGNQNISLKWKHSFNDKLYSVFTTGFDRYYYSIYSERDPVNAYSLSFDVNQGYLKAHFNYYKSPKHTIEFGFNSIYYKLHPGTYEPMGMSSLVIPDEISPEQALESALYISDKYIINNAFSIEGGLRYSLFNYLGPATVNHYVDGQPKTEDNITGKSEYSGLNVIKTYGGPEVRLSGRYAFSPTLSVKGGYNSGRQYIHVLSNTAAMAPTDIWKLSDPNINPQKGDQVSLGLYKNLKSNTIETSIEVYYKRIKDYLDYKSGAVLVLNHHIETDVISTRGKAYGIELLVRKSNGKMNGWISYTYSRTLLKMDDPTAGEVINDGAYYPANYDKPHDATFVGNYRFTHRFSISFIATYSTGRPITLPVGRFYYEGSYRTLYADRNAYRIPDYFRTDFSMNIEGNHKIHQRLHNSWTIGVYNVTARKNPYSVYFVSENGVINGYKLSIFGTAIPFINFNVRF